MHSDTNKQGITCPVCGNNQSQEILLNRKDLEYGVKYDANYWKCLNGNCELVFVSPLPTQETVGSYYSAYTTHTSNVSLNFWAIISKVNRRIYLKNLRNLLNNTDLQSLKVLDYGCGNGNLLQDISTIGAKNVIGYDLDPEAVAFAKSQGFNAFSDRDVIALNGPYNFIFLNHVIEHLIYPDDDIKEIISYLDTDGKLIIRTPNSRSLLSRIFKDNWRGWETPRHLHVFNVNAIKKLISSIDGIEIYHSATSNLMFVGVFNGSFHSTFFLNTLSGKLLRKFMQIIIYPFVLMINSLNGNVGEELVLVIKKKT